MKYRNPSASNEIKDKIQAKLREIVIKRDGGCILRNRRFCGGTPSHAVLQADHLITRANSATYADPRLVVCLCRACHGWKHWHKEEYDALVKTILPEPVVALWERCQRDSWRSHRKYTADWKLALVALENELKQIA